MNDQEFIKLAKKGLNKLAFKILRILMQKKIVKTKQVLADISSQQNTRVKEIQDFIGCTCRTNGKGRSKTCKAARHVFKVLKYSGKRKVSYTHYENDLKDTLEALGINQVEEKKEPYKRKFTDEEVKRKLFKANKYEITDEMVKLKHRIIDAERWFENNLDHPKKDKYFDVYLGLLEKYDNLKGV